MSNQITDNAVSSSLSTLTIQNPEVTKLIRPEYNQAELDTARVELVAHDTLTLRRYPSGGQSAVTVLDIYETLVSAIDGKLINMWDRDNIMQALAEYELAKDDALRLGLKIDKNAWRRGLMATLKHHKKADKRFIDLLKDRVSLSDPLLRPHIRVCPTGLIELTDKWGHAQNDALGFMNFMLFHALRKGDLNWQTDIDIQPDALTVATLLHALFWKIKVWEDNDLGAWEDKAGIHWSSVASVLVSLREQLAWFQKQGADFELTYNSGEDRFMVRQDGLKELIVKCENKLVELANNECPNVENSVRSVDLAMINPMLLAAFAGQPIVDDANTELLLDKIEAELLGEIGVRRYVKDVWDGRKDRFDLGKNDEAQWVHGSPQMSYIYGEMYQRTGEERFYKKQVLHFNRALASISPRWRTPEAYIIHAETRAWVADENEPLAWAQAVLVMAFAGMKRSITKHEAAATASSGAASAATTTAGDNVVVPAEGKAA